MRIEAALMRNRDGARLAKALGMPFRSVSIHGRLVSGRESTRFRKRCRRVIKALADLERRALYQRSQRFTCKIDRIISRLEPGICGVYVIRCEQTGRFKIGMTSCLASRLAAHVKGGVPRLFGPLRLTRFIGCMGDAEAKAVESALHCYYDTLLVSGERTMTDEFEAHLDRRAAGREVFRHAEEFRQPETFTSAAEVFSWMAEKSRLARAAHG